MKLTLDDRKLLHKILGEAFPSLDDLDQMAQLNLGVPIAFITAAGAVPHMVLKVIQWAEARDRVLELMEAAREANPSNSNLKDLAIRLLPGVSGAAPTAALGAAVQRAEFTSADDLAAREGSWAKTTAPQITTEVLQRIALQSLAFDDTAQWRDRMAERERAVCRVEFPCESGQGTGFLVRPDLVMTNYHVLQLFIEAARTPSEICCRFGYQKTGESQPVNMGDAYPLADDWLVASSPIDQLDYAIVRLRSDAGTAATPRTPLQPAAHAFETGEAMFIIQHPKAAPLKVAVGGLVKTAPTRVFYLANTLRGSSGSPCFTANWDLVALHRAGEDVANVGVPFAAILPDVGGKQPGIFA